MKTSKVMKRARALILAGILVAVTLAGYWHQVYGGAKVASIHALCPYGGLESLYSWITSGALISKIFQGTMILFFITLVLALLFKRSFCGLLCPFGALQEGFGKIGAWIFRGRKRPEIPKKMDRPLRYLKYGILALTLYYAWITAGLWMAPYDPWSAYAHLFSSTPLESFNSLLSEAPIGLFLLLITIGGSILYDRFFCKYLCPMGAFYGLVGKASPFKIVRSKDACINCGQCTKVCPVGIDVQHVEQVKSAECLDCQLCTLNCPAKGALTVSWMNKSLKPITVGLLVLSLFFGSIGLAQWAGLYQMTPERTILSPGQVISFEDIKGYMTIEEAAKATGTELDAFYEKMGIDRKVPATTSFKDLETLMPGYDFHGMKEKNSK